MSILGDLNPFSTSGPTLVNPLGQSNTDSLLESLGGILGIGGDSASALAEDAAKQNEANEQVTAEEAAIRSVTNLAEQEQANRSTEGAQRAAIGGSGVKINTGSPLDAQYATWMQDQFKDKVAVFNGQVDVAADQAAQIAQASQGAAAAAGATANAVSSDAGTASALASILEYL